MARTSEWRLFAAMLRRAAVGSLAAAAGAALVMSGGWVGGIAVPPPLAALSPFLLMTVAALGGLLMALPATVLVGVPLAWRAREALPGGASAVSLLLTLSGAMAGLWVGILFDRAWHSLAWWWPGLVSGACHAAVLARLATQRPLPVGGGATASLLRS